MNKKIELELAILEDAITENNGEAVDLILGMCVDMLNDGGTVIVKQTVFFTLKDFIRWIQSFFLNF